MKLTVCFITYGPKDTTPPLGDAALLSDISTYNFKKAQPPENITLPNSLSLLVLVELIA